MGILGDLAIPLFIHTGKPSGVESYILLRGVESQILTDATLTLPPRCSLTSLYDYVSVEWGGGEPVASATSSSPT
jgi:hypothetical protein